LLRDNEINGIAFDKSSTVDKPMVRGGVVEKLVERLTYFKYPGNFTAPLSTFTLPEHTTPFSLRPRIPPRLFADIPVFHHAVDGVPTARFQVSLSLSPFQSLMQYRPEYCQICYHRFELGPPPGLNQSQFTIFMEKKIKPTRLRFESLSLRFPLEV